MTFYNTTIAALCFAATSVCSAATVQVDFDSYIFSGSGYDAVTIKFPNAGGNGSSTHYVAAGRFQGTASNVVGVPTSIFVDGLNDLFMYCYDVYESIHGGQSVNYTINLDGEKAGTRDFLGAVNSIMNTGKPVQDPYAWLHPVSGAQGAAIQLGIWESLYETSPKWSLANGAFQAGNLDAGTSDWVNRFFGAVGTSDALDGKFVMTLEARGAQDMITGDPPPSQVPEPHSAVLVGLGLAAAAAMRKHKA